MSGLVSRRHVRLTVTALGVSVEDLGSRNGAYVNSERVVGSMLMRSGDRLAVGDEILVLGDIEEPIKEELAATLAALPAAHSELREYPARSEPTERESTIDYDLAFATRNADIFKLLATVVDKALALGRAEEAEHLIAAHLETALEDVLAGRYLAPDIARSAAGYAVKLAGATNQPRWLDHAVRLYRTLGLVLPLALVDEMYVLLRRVRGIDLDELRLYTDQLRERAGSLAPAERFVLQRLLGLERLATWQMGSGR